MPKLKNDLFLRACKKRKVERTPIWIMRQAGRYLPEYRAIKKKYDFLTICKTPELAAEVTLQPVNILGVDAAILFSDILVVPEAMGMKFTMTENQGPVFEKTLRTKTDIKNLKKIDPYKDLKFVLDAVELTKKELDSRVPLIGFSGSPWTLLAYMVEGKGGKGFSKVKRLIYDNPEMAHSALNKIADGVSDYLNAKIQAGCDAIQIFDTWGGILTQEDFYEFSLEYVTKVISNLNLKDVPVIYYSKGVHYRFRRLAKIGADVLGFDWTIDLGRARERVGDRVAVQGNLDPTILHAEKNIIAERAFAIMESYGKGPGHIFNLGHGIPADVSPEKVKFLVDFVKESSVEFH